MLRLKVSSRAEGRTYVSVGRHRAWPWALALVALVVFMAPMVLTNGSFSSDWSIHLWIAWNQYLMLADVGHPSYFLQTDHAAFFPWFSFYGGTLYSVVAGLAGLMGGRVTGAYIAVHAMAVAAALGGWAWLAHNLGVRGWRSHLPGLVFVTSAYYVTNFYGRGAFPEVVATSMLPLVAASTVHLVRRGLTPLPSVTFVVSVAILTGSHSITLVWGSTFLLSLIFAAAVAIPRGRWPSRRRLARVAGLGAVGVGLNAWFLLPLLAFNSRVVIGVPPAELMQTEFTEVAFLFDVLRETPQLPEVVAVINAQVPVLALGWGLVAIVVGWRRLDGTWQRLAIMAAALLYPVLLLVVFEQAILDLPKIWGYIQFPYRLLTYVGLFVALLVLVGLKATQSQGPRARKALTAVLVATTVVSAGLAIRQAWEVPSPNGPRARIFESPDRPPPGWYVAYDYADISAPVVVPTLSRPLVISTAGRRQDRYAVFYPTRRGGTVATNVAAGEYLVDVDGADPVGRTPEGFMVVRVAKPEDGSARVTFAPKSSALTRAGLALTALSLLTWLVVTTLLVRRSSRRPRRNATLDP